MIPSLYFQNHSAAVTRPERTDLASTLQHVVKWSAVTGMSALPCAFQERGHTPFATDVGVIYAESAEIYVDVDVLPSGGSILTGDRMTIDSVAWEVQSAEKINHGGIDRHYRCFTKRVNT